VKNLPYLYVVSVLALAACSGSLFQSKTPPPSVYLLSAKAVPSGAEIIPVDLAVLKPRVRTGLDTDLIAALYPDRRLDYFAGARWSGPLDEVVQDLALQAFRGRARFRNVHADASAFGSGYWLEIDVADFQAEYFTDRGAAGGGAPTVHVHLIGRVGNSSDRRILGRFEADQRQPATDNRVTAIVEAYNQAADAALGQIVAETAETLNRNLERR
jgi:cholesterol transport system auxiliary component